jgi:hypothetical protein
MAKAAAPTPLDAELLGMPKGEAAPAPVAGVSQAPEPPPRPPIIVDPPVVEVIRTALTVRLPRKTLERLREAAHRTRAEKQEIVDEALSVWLDEHGF